MKKIKKRAKVILPLLLTLTFIASGVFSFVPAGVNATTNNHVDQVKICHRTSSHDTPYDPQWIDESGITGHDKHNGPTWYQGINQDWGDIIPPADEWSFSPSSGYVGYSGKNWDSEGQEIWNNDCEIPNGDDSEVDEDSLMLTAMCIEEEDSDTKTKWRITNDSGVDVDYTYEVYSGGETGSGTVDSEHTKAERFDDPYYFYVDEPHPITLKIYWGDDSEFSTTKASTDQICEPEVIDDAKISPILECVEGSGKGGYRAHFGYETHNDVDITIPIGDDNKFTGGGIGDQDQGQPTLFEYPAPDYPSEDRKGRTGFYPENPFSVDFDGTNLVWTLKGPDGNTRTATASSDSKMCPEEETFDLVAHKVVCDSEDDLPDWAKDQNQPSKITQPLIIDYVNNSNGACRFASGWYFEWGEKDVNKKPGDYVGTAGEGWNTFGPTDNQTGKAMTTITYEDDDPIWVREVLKDGYIPFSDFEDGQDSVSAELLCNTDGYKYDNYDRVDDPEAGETYYCVGFNVPEEEEIPYYESEKSCPPGYVPEHMDTYQVNSQDPDGIEINLSSGTYLFEASGTFVPTSAPNWKADAGYSSNDNWSSVLPDYGIQGTDPHYGAHSLLGDLSEGVGVINWGDYDSSHEYDFYYQLDGGDYQFLIGDRYGDWFDTEWQDQEGMDDNEGDLTLDVSKCVREEDKATLVATKIICEDEEYLPNWGENKMDGNPITSTSAQDFLDEVNDEEEVCWLAPDWEFEWAPLGTANPGDDHYGYGGGSWTPFGPTNQNGSVQISIDLEELGTGLFFREVLKPGYIHFADEFGDSDVSAEFYCDEDVFNYDNLDQITGMEEGETYYCLGFNVPKKTDVEVCKMNPDEEYLPEWEIGLASEMIEGPTMINVTNEDGTDSSNLEEGYYMIRVTGTYNYGTPDMIADAGYSWRPTSINYGCDCWFSGFDLPSGKGLMALINEEPVYWGTYDSGHEYTTIYHHETSGEPVNLSIYDDIYGDNENDGDFSFEIYKMDYHGFTGSEGCITFEDVPSGDYILDEWNVMGWNYLSGLGEVMIDEENNFFTIINEEIQEEDTAKIIVHKIVCEDEEYLPNWGADEDLGSPITSQTASNFLASVNDDEKVCWLEPDWEFQWGYYGEVSNPGDSYVGETGGNWNTFGPTNQNGMTSVFIPLMEEITRLDFREVLKSGYIPFSYGANNETNVDDYSAEFYCGEDVFNYDNWDWVNNPEPGETYYCIAFNTETEEEPTPPTPSNGTNGVSRSRRSSAVRFFSTPTEEGEEEKPEEEVFAPEVVGVIAPSLIDSFQNGGRCGIYLTEYIKFGADNNPDEVKKLQEFLNEYMSSDLEVDGFYGREDMEVLERFQLKHKAEVLRPWVEAGIHDNENNPTGYVYRTTQRAINMIMCPQLNLPPADLSGDYQTEVPLDYEYEFSWDDFEDMDEETEDIEEEEEEEREELIESLVGTVQDPEDGNRTGAILMSLVLVSVAGLVGYKAYSFYLKK